MKGQRGEALKQAKLAHIWLPTKKKVKPVHKNNYSYLKLVIEYR